MSDAVRWKPGVAEPEPAPTQPAQATAEALAAARAQGRAEAQAELWLQHDRLAQLCTSMRGLQLRSLDWLAGAALEVAFLVIEAWLEGSDADRRARLRPVIEQWISRVGAGAVATAIVSEVDAQTWRELVAELPITVQVDRGLPAGDVRLRGERAMIELSWRERLAELRGELLAVLPEMPSTVDERGSARETAPPLPGRATRDPEQDFGITRRWARLPP